MMKPVKNQMETRFCDPTQRDTVKSENKYNWRFGIK